MIFCTALPPFIGHSPSCRLVAIRLETRTASRNHDSTPMTPAPPPLSHKFWRFFFARLFKNQLSSTPRGYAAYQPEAMPLSPELQREYRTLLAKFCHNNAKVNAGDIPRLWAIMLNCQQILKEGIPGDFSELGVFRGNSAAVLAHYARQQQRKTLLFDTFEGFDPQDLTGVDQHRASGGFDTDAQSVKDFVGEGAELVPGRFPDSLQEHHKTMTFALVSLDCDLYEPMAAGLDFFYPRLSPGGLLMVHDYSCGHWRGVVQAVDEFCTRTGERLICLPDRSGSAFIRKTRPA